MSLFIRPISRSAAAIVVVGSGGAGVARAQICAAAGPNLQVLTLDGIVPDDAEGDSSAGVTGSPGWA